MKEIVNKNINLQSIGAGIKIYVSDQHPFGTDAILLADFAAPKRREIACDMGTGCGIIPFLWSRYDSPKKISAIEIQKNAAELFKMSLEENSMQDRITLYNCDIRDIDSSFDNFGRFDLVTMNPPYKPANTGIESADESQRIARHEITCTISDTVAAADKLLKFSGRLCICHRPERLAQIIFAMKSKKIEPKRIRFVSNKAGDEPWLVLIEGRKGAGEGLRIIPELHIRNNDGSWTREMLEIYGDYGDGTK